MIFDTHCHLDFTEFDADRERVLERCADLGVCRFLLPGVVAAHWSRIRRLSARYGSLLPAYGLHPCFTSSHQSCDIQRLKSLVQIDPPVAIGEIGLDCWQGAGALSEQMPLFTEQLQLAKMYDLPVLLHVRKAHDQVLHQLRRFRLERGGVVHAFSGSMQQAEEYIELGFRIGVGGGVTYPRAQKLRRVLALLPESALLLETDAPDMPLCGFQGLRNTPEKLPLVLQALAELRGADVGLLRSQLWQNSCDLFEISR